VLDITPFPLAADEVMVKVEACGVCGSDLRYYQGENPWSLHTKEWLCPIRPTSSSVTSSLAEWSRRRAARRPSGRQACSCVAVSQLRDVRELPARTAQPVRQHDSLRSWGRLGQNGLLSGGMAEYCPVWAEKCYVLPEHVPAHEAALLDGLGVSLHAVRTAGFLPGKDVAVIGCGPIGLGIAAIAAAWELVISSALISMRRRSVSPRRSPAARHRCACRGPGDLYS